MIKERRTSATSVPELDKEKEELDTEMKKTEALSGNQAPSVFNKFNNFRHDYVNKILPLQMMLKSPKSNPESLKKYLNIPKFSDVYKDENPKKEDGDDIMRVDQLIDDINNEVKNNTIDKATLLKKVDKIIAIIQKSE